MTFTAPVDYNSVLRELPDDVFPYGEDCPINRGVQSVLFHYRIPEDDVANLAIEEFFTLQDFLSANPDGTVEEQQLYDDTVNCLFTKSLRRRRMLLAVRRLLSADPVPAIVAAPRPSPAVVAAPPPPPPSSGKRKIPGADVISLPAKKSSGDKDSSSPASADKSAPAPDGDGVVTDSPSDTDVDSDKDGVDASKPSTSSSSSSSQRDLNAHFDDVADEVCVHAVV